MKIKNLNQNNKHSYRSRLDTLHNLVTNIKNFICMHPIIVLSILMAGTAIYVFYQFLFERQIFVFSDVGSDTKNVYYPFFVSIARKIEQGDFSLWDFSYGTGVNILTRQADVGSIFTYLTCALGRRGIKYALVWVHVFKIFISGYLCYFYLNSFKFTTISKVMVSYIYAFNGFMILWGQHYFLGTASICIILMLWSIELSFKSPKGYICLALSTFMVMCTSYYFAYMILLFSAVYVLFRLCYIYSFKEVKKVIKSGGGLLCAVFVGACLSAFIFLPSVYIVVSTSARLGADTSILDRIREFASSSYDQTTIQSIISRVFSNNLMGTEDFAGPLNYYELPQWFFSSFTLFVGIVFVLELILEKSENIKRKVIKILGIVLVLFTAFHPFVSFVFNGFVTLFFRYTYLFMPVLGLCYASVFDKLFYNKLICAKFEIFIAGAISLWAMSNNIYNINTSSRNAEFLGCSYLLMTAMFIMLSILVQGEKRESIKRIVCIMGSGLLIVTNVSMESFVTNNARTATSEIDSKIYATSGNDSVQAALSELQEGDHTFYRIEKTFQDTAYLNDSLLQGYYGVSTYNSVINKNLIEFKNQICPEFQVTESEGYYDFQQIVENVDVVSLLGVKYILSLDYMDNVPEYEYLKTVENVHIYQNTATDGVAKFFANAVDYETFTVLEQQEKRDLIGDIVIINGLEEDVTDVVENEKSTVYFENPTNSSHIVGKVDARCDGWVFVAIPYEDGWKAYVDGKKTEILQADIGFSAIRVEKGNHEITFRYQTPYLKEGIIVSCVGVMLLFMWCTEIYIHTKKSKKSK